MFCLSAYEVKIAGSMLRDRRVANLLCYTRFFHPFANDTVTLRLQSTPPTALLSQRPSIAAFRVSTSQKRLCAKVKKRGFPP